MSHLDYLVGTAEVLAADNAKLSARNAELEQMVAVLMRHEARDDTIKVQKSRIAELEAALRPFTDVESIIPFFDDAGWGLYAHVVTKRDMEAARAAYLGTKDAQQP